MPTLHESIVRDLDSIAVAGAIGESKPTLRMDNEKSFHEDEFTNIIEHRITKALCHVSPDSVAYKNRCIVPDSHTSGSVSFSELVDEIYEETKSYLARQSSVDI